MDDSPGEEHLQFMQWAISQGVKIQGIAPARFPGRRLGMMATRVIEKNEVMLAVPSTAMLTIDSIPKSFVDLFPKETSIHGILAAFLTKGDPELLSSLDVWRKVWPSWEEFEETLPVFWPERLRSTTSHASTGNQSQQPPVVLPPAISGQWNTFDREEGRLGVEYYETRYQNLLTQQDKRLKDNAWAHIVTVFPDMDWTEFAYNWSIINSRSFYYISPGKEEPDDWNDAIAMVPFADYFNHVDDAACEVKFDGKKYTFKATRRYDQGEEIFMSYGSHSNDFLLIEYGFYLDDNPSDAIYLDDIIFRQLTRAEKKELLAQGCFGNYEILSSGPGTDATSVACLKYMSRKDWREYVAGNSQRGFDAEKTAAIIRGWVQTYLAECEQAKEGIMNLSSDPATTKGEILKLKIALARWEQIQRLCKEVLRAIEEPRK